VHDLLKTCNDTSNKVLETHAMSPRMSENKKEKDCAEQMIMVANHENRSQTPSSAAITSLSVDCDDCSVSNN